LFQEYDYLFDVDLGADRPQLKLGYNKGEDPWVAAQRFIHEEELPQEFIDQIANFIISQTKEVAHLYPTAAAQDPFTGGSRYIPGGSASGVGGSGVGGAADPFTGASGYRPTTGADPGMANGAGGVDPFTGANRYVPGGAAASKGDTSTSESSIAAGAGDFPIKEYLSFVQGNRKAMSGERQSSLRFLHLIPFLLFLAKTIPDTILLLRYCTMPLVRLVPLAWS
jgi:hypothetical protein